MKPARVGTRVESPVRGTLLEYKQEIGVSHSHLRFKKSQGAAATLQEMRYKAAGLRIVTDSQKEEEGQAALPLD